MQDAIIQLAMLTVVFQLSYMDEEGQRQVGQDNKTASINKQN